MKLVLFDDFVPGVLCGDNVVDVSDRVSDVPHVDGQTWMSGIIARFDDYRAALEDAASAGGGVRPPRTSVCGRRCRSRSG